MYCISVDDGLKVYIKVRDISIEEQNSYYCVFSKDHTQAVHHLLPHNDPELKESQIYMKHQNNKLCYSSVIESFSETRMIYPITGRISHEMKTTRKIKNTMFSKNMTLKSRQSE